MLCLLPSGRKQRKELQQLKLLEVAICIKLLSLCQAHSVASFCHFKFCMKARQNNATHSLNSQKDLTPGTLPITVLHNSETCIHCVKNIILPYVSATHKDLVLGEEHMAVVIFDTFKGHTGSEMES